MSDEMNLVESETSVAMEAEKSKAIQKIQSALAIAKRFPRDQIKAVEKIIVECQRKSLAEKARYSYPRGGEKITGPTIRLAEVIARHWGNLKYGFRELEQKHNASTIEAYCWDLETNTEVTREFSVPHSRKAGGKIVWLSDPRDIYELVANNAQRRVRACILEIIPGDIVDKSLAQCARTLSTDSKEPLIDSITRLVLNFSKLGVTKDLIEQRLNHKSEEINSAELVDLIDIYNSLKENASKRSDWFKVNEISETGGKAAELSQKLEVKRAADKAAPPELLPFEKSPK